ncbi:MAG: radical SAM/SPASM domain-containing protein [Nitrososphaerota archaeon]
MEFMDVPKGILQIEVTSRCNACCIMCPKPFMGDEWNAGDLSLEDYLRLVEYFEGFKVIWLQGWGEPLLSKHIFEMVKIASKNDGLIGLTTNATLLTESVSEKLIENGVKTIAVSIAGSRKETHESIRVGTNFNKIIENVQCLERLRRSRNARDLRIIFTFLRIKQNIRELPEVVELASRLNVDEIVGTNIDYIPSKKHYEMKVFSYLGEDPPKEYVEIIKESEERARENGISIYNYPLMMGEVAVCSENPVENIYISHDGAVSPCVYLNVPTKNNLIPRYIRNKQYFVPRLVFGSIKKERLIDIYNKSDLSDFRKVYKKRVDNWKTSTDFLSRFLDFSNLTNNSMRLPDPCFTCYKAYGV